MTFARRVTLATLSTFAPLLNQADACNGGQGTSASGAKPPVAPDPALAAAEALFGGEPTHVDLGFPRARRPLQDARQQPAPTAAPPPMPPVPANPSLRWWKKLFMSDVMRKPASSHQRNHVILGQAGHPIDQKTWFRDVFFSAVSWSTETMRTGNVKDVVDIHMEVFVNEVSQGAFSIRVDHAENRIADQNNAPTWLQWSELTRLIRSRDFTGWYLILERFDPATYRLRLTQTKPA